MPKKLTQRRLMTKFVYDPETGSLFYKKSNKKAGYDDGRGYLLTVIDGERHYNHRLAWLYIYGYLPENCIDHINRDPSDNRICNLREVSMQCNVRNNSLAKTNTSGVKGVHWQRGRQVWEAYITVSGKRKALGKRKNKFDAVMLRYLAEKKYAWNTCSGLTSAEQYLVSCGKETGVEGHINYIWSLWTKHPNDKSPKDITYLQTGLIEEFGELVGKFKRISRGDSVCPMAIIYEAGDILWNVLQICVFHNISFKRIEGTSASNGHCTEVNNFIDNIMTLQRLVTILCTSPNESDVCSFISILLSMVRSCTQAELPDILLANRMKLDGRYRQGKIQGSGDYR